MLDTIADIKNNTGKVADMSERLEVLRRWIVQASKSIFFFFEIIYSESQEDIRKLQMTWDDILDVDSKGRWWLVGSAWAGKTENNNVIKTLHAQGLQTSAQSAALVKKAKDLGMNTDLRRAIFFLIMNAEDFMDAFEKLVRLDLKTKQDRDVVRVIVECCCHEQKYNPYYFHLANKLCEFDKGYKKSFQVAIWDGLNKIDTATPRVVANKAKFLCDMFKQKNESIVTLKAIKWQTLDKNVILFLHILLIDIIMEEPEEFVAEFFLPVSQNPELSELRDGLIYYLSSYFVPTLNLKAKYEPELIKRRFKIVKRAIESNSEFN